MIVTQENAYVATIKNWSALQTLYNEYLANPTVFNSNIVYKSQNVYESAEAAIMDVFGAAINFYTVFHDDPNHCFPLILSGSNPLDMVHLYPCQ